MFFQKITKDSPDNVIEKTKSSTDEHTNKATDHAKNSHKSPGF